MDDDDFLYGDSTPAPPSKVVTPVPTTPTAPIPTPVPESIPFAHTREASEEPPFPPSSAYETVLPPTPQVESNGTVEMKEETPIATYAEEGEGEGYGEAEGEAEGEGEGEGDDEGDDEEEADESEDDVEFIMEPAPRSLDLRPGRPSGPRNTSSNFTPQKAPPHGGGPSLTTEYTPRDRNGLVKPPSGPQASSQTSQPSSSVPPSEAQSKADDGPDPATLPPITAPPSHPSIDPSQPGIVDGRPVFEVDIANLADKGWRRPGSDLSDWFNYGFDEISWEAYCYRRREMGETASVLKTNVVNFSGMPEDQLTQLPPELRQMVMAGTNAMINNSGVPNGQMMQGMLGPGDMNNMGAMGNMNMQQMMNPMMVGMGEMGMDGPQAQGQPQEGMQGMGPGVGMNGEGYGPQGGPQNMGMGAMGMPGEYGMQDPGAMQQQMYQNMEAPQAPTPVQASAGPGMVQGPQGPQGPRGAPQGPYRGGRGMGMRGVRGGFGGRGRGGPPAPMRPASPLPPNVPTGPRNQNKYKDRDNNAPAVDGLDYGGGQERGSRTPTDVDDRSSRKRRERSPSDDRRDAKRR